jgi:hypothetical protein
MQPYQREVEILIRGRPGRNLHLLGALAEMKPEVLRELFEVLRGMKSEIDQEKRKRPLYPGGPRIRI